MSSAQTEPGRLFVVSAPSGAGKTSLTHAVIKRLAAQGRSVRFSVSYTTRKPRGAEQDGVDYNFVSQAEFKEMIAQEKFLEHAQVFDQFYGTGREQTDKTLAEGHDVVLDIDWQGAQQVRSTTDEVTSIFIMPPSRDELERRLRERAADEDTAITRRLAEAEEEMAHAREYDHVVTNDCFEQAIDDLLALFTQA